MRITRKQFLIGAGAGILGSALPGFAAVDSSPNQDLVGLPTKEEIWAWEQFLASLAPLWTASPNHTKYVNFLDAELRKAGLKPQRKTYTLPLWELKDHGLKLGGEKIAVTGYRAYTGPTPPEGVTAPMYYAGLSPNVDYSGASGKIVLIDAPLLHHDWAGTMETLGTYPMSEIDTVLKDEYSAMWSGNAAPDMAAAEAAGAVGAIYIWNNVSDGAAQYQVEPFSGKPTKVPTVWVGNSTGQRLKKLAAKGTPINLTLHAVSHPDSPSDNLWAVLPGKTDEVIIINTHTDGCNACEENGSLGVISLAKHFARLPVSQRNRTLVFVMTTGHFAHGYFHGTQDWRDTHPDLMKKAVACVTIEHLGATEWIDDAAANTYKPSGKYAWGQAFTPLRPEGMVFLQAVAGTGAKRTVAMKPSGSYPGEGAGFWAAGVPTISYICGPPFLMTAPVKDGQIAKLNSDRMYGEIVTFAKCVAELDKMSVSSIKGPAPATKIT